MFLNVPVTDPAIKTPCVSFRATDDVTSLSALSSISHKWRRTETPKKGILKTGQKDSMPLAVDTANYKKPIWDSEDFDTTSLDETFSGEEMTEENSVQGTYSITHDHNCRLESGMI